MKNDASHNQTLCSSSTGPECPLPRQLLVDRHSYESSPSVMLFASLKNVLYPTHLKVIFFSTTNFVLLSPQSCSCSQLYPWN